MARLAVALSVATVMSAGLAVAEVAQRYAHKARLLATALPVHAQPTPFHPLARIGLLPVPHALRPDQGLLARLSEAGDPWPIEVVAGMRLILAACGLLLGLLASTRVPIALPLVPVLGLVGLRLPGMALARIAKRRRAAIGARVPDLVELLVTTTQAGLSPALAFRRSGELIPGPLGEDVRAAVKQMDLGVPWSQALGGLVERTGEPSLRRLARALARSGRLGTSVNSTLRSVAEDLRGERQARAEELARRAPVKMLFPLVFLVLPAFLLLTVGPVLLATLRSLH